LFENGVGQLRPACPIFASAIKKPYTNLGTTGLLKPKTDIKIKYRFVDL
jgi:hypothetical protein